jgi:Carboxypeptidase regulatory-like domain
MTWKRSILLFGSILTMAVLSCQPAWSQAIGSAGTIQGTVVDQQGAIVTSAKVSITSKATGAIINPPVSSQGIFNSGPLTPGDFIVKVEAAGFETVQLPVVVQVGNISNASVTLQLGAANTVINVEGSAVQLNTEQPTIQGVVTQEQIVNLPINGRNFLDLAGLEPGVQIQDGGNFDPTKNGFSSISFGGRFGRTARIELDGIDVSDETVGTTTQNIPISAIDEFQVTQSSLDLSTELTSSGSVNVSTRSGTNGYHGGGFFQWRGDGTGARIGPADSPAVYDRKQYGANFGGPFIKDKLFFFGAWERTKQATQESVNLAGTPFNILSGTLPNPFLDNELFGRLDWQISPNYRMFYRFGYEHGDDVAGFVPNTYSPFGNVDYTPSHVVGLDFITGSYTHAIRFGYMKFRNAIANALNPASLPDPAPGIMLAIGNVSTSCEGSGDLVCFGPNTLAPQVTYQSNTQFKYDGSKVLGNHIIRYGIGFNRIRGGGFASFFGIAPAVRSLYSGSNIAIAATGPFAALDTGVGPASNPLNWPVNRIYMGNGFGCSTSQPAFGYDCGGQFDNRFQWYIGDAWKIRPSVTLTYGLRYVRDTGRTDSQIPPIPCPAGLSFPCTGNLLDNLTPGLGGRVRQPNDNFAPQLGVAWAPWGSTKTVIRAGAGIFYENAVFNNVLFDQPTRLPTGLFFGTSPLLCSGGLGSMTFPDGTVVSSINGKDIATQICGQPVGSVATDIADLQTAFQKATATAGAAANGAYLGNTLSSGPLAGPMFGPNYQTPRSYQMNIGIQREIAKNTVLSVDYLRNVGLHTLLAIDQNFNGDSRFLDMAGAQGAIATTLANCGVATIDQSLVSCPTDPGTGTNDNGKWVPRPAVIGDYANNGLTSGTLYTGGVPAGPGTVAFPGKNANFGQVQLLEPVGRSMYNALEVKLRSNLHDPTPWVKNLGVEISYSLSRYTSAAQDSDFINTPAANVNPNRFNGPNALDRTHQLSAGVTSELPFGIKINFITHWDSALPQNIFFNAPGNAEDLFQYDTTGDGLTNSVPVPGSKLGAFGRSVKVGDLQKFLEQYSSKYGNQITPAGQALVNAGLFTTQQLQELCAVTPSLNPLPGCGNSGNASQDGLQLPSVVPGAVGNDALFTFDLRLGWSIKPVRSFEQFSIEPQVAFFNLFNHPNYNGVNGLLAGVLDNTPGGTGAINNTTRATRQPTLIGLGTGVFSDGSPRTIEFGIKVNF